MSRWKKIETHSVVFETRNYLFFLASTPVVYLYAQLVYMKPGQDISVILF
jgi:hypothetical protein